MKLRNKLIATIVSISMVLAVIGVGAWASTESFTATITNTVNLEFDNIKGRIFAIGLAGADNVDPSDAPMLQEYVYDGSTIIYNQISSSATNGTNLYWEGTGFLDASDQGLQMVDSQTKAGVCCYAFMYEPTEECVGTSNITIMIEETNLPEISGGKLMVKYFATTDEETYTELQSGVAITPIADNEMVVILAVCQYYNLDGESIATTASAWDFNVVFSAGREARTALAGNVTLGLWGYTSGVILPYDYEAGAVNVLSITSASGFEVNDLDGVVSVMGQAGADNREQDAEPYLEETVIYDGSNLLYSQISGVGMRGTSLYWEGANFLDATALGTHNIDEDTTMAVFGYTFKYKPTDNCTGSKTITINIDEISRPEVFGGQLTIKYYASLDGQFWIELREGVNVTPIADNEEIAVGAVCQFYNLKDESISTIASPWNFNISFTAGSEIKTGLDGEKAILNIQSAGMGALLPYDNHGYQDSHWEIIEIGEYPQTLKAQNVSIVSQTPDENGYYLGSDGERYMEYTISTTANMLAIGGQDLIDVTAVMTAGDGTKMKLGQTYYFKVEPIKWRVLKESNGQTLVVSDKVLAAQYYHAEGGYESSHPDAPDGTPANNYKYSDIREYLTGEFYSKHFSAAEKEIILLTNVDNSAATTNDTANTSACENTNDYVFALSYKDITNPEYGFNSDPNEPDVARCWDSTDYAKATGVQTQTAELILAFAESRIGLLPYAGHCPIWTRSPQSSSDGSDNYYLAWLAGAVVKTFAVNKLDGNYAGFAPAMYITR